MAAEPAVNSSALCGRTAQEGLQSHGRHNEMLLLSIIPPPSGALSQPQVSASWQLRAERGPLTKGEAGVHGRHAGQAYTRAGAGYLCVSSCPPWGPHPHRGGPQAGAARRSHPHAGLLAPTG